MIKAILFDFDGTIVDSLKHHLASYREAYKHFGKTPTDEEIIREAFYTPIEHKTNHYGISDVQKFREIYVSRIDKALKHFSTHEHLTDTLDSLKGRGIKFAIISFADSSVLKRNLEHLKILHYFTAILGNNDVIKPKPDGEIAQKAAKILGVKTEECLLVGDTDIDIRTGKNAGTKTVLFVPDANLYFIDLEKYREAKPDFEFNDFTQLPRIVEQF